MFTPHFRQKEANILHLINSDVDLFTTVQIEAEVQIENLVIHSSDKDNKTDSSAKISKVEVIGELERR